MSSYTDRAETIDGEMIRVDGASSSGHAVLKSLRHCLGSYPTGVAILTVVAGSSVHGITINSFVSVSLEPPLVLVSLSRSSRMAGILSDISFGINVLSKAQRDLALVFSGKWHGERTPVRWQWAGPVPLIDGCAAYITCEPWEKYDGGDHMLHVAKVNAFSQTGRDPLLFHRGELRGLGADAEEKDWDMTLDGRYDGVWIPAAGTMEEEQR